jgi:DNA-3-methyladenine glycosylase
MGKLQVSSNPFIERDGSMVRLDLIHPSFYLGGDPVEIARCLLGKILYTRVDGRPTAGRIAETEAYCGPEDRASHAWGNRRTSRTQTMFMAGGHAYVYRCYGIHDLFNVVTGPEGIPHAVLIRAVEPLEGQAEMASRRGLIEGHEGIGRGPGCLTRALGIDRSANGVCLHQLESPVQLCEGLGHVEESDIAATPRIGVDYAGEWALRPWRFYLVHSRSVSGRKRPGR